mgnify:CR=1 FL=1
MKRMYLMLALAPLLTGCSNMSGLAPGITAAAMLAGTAISAKSYADNQKDREKNEPMRKAELENACVSQLRGSIDKWPEVCSHTLLSKMDACGRAGFDTTPLCNGQAVILRARYQQQEKNGTEKNVIKKVASKTANKTGTSSVTVKTSSKKKPEPKKEKAKTPTSL